MGCRYLRCAAYYQHQAVRHLKLQTAAVWISPSVVVKYNCRDLLTLNQLGLTFNLYRPVGQVWSSRLKRLYSYSHAEILSILSIGACEQSTQN